MFKVCSRCKLQKDEEEFHFKNKALNKRRECCKACWSKYHKEHYTQNKGKYIASAAKTKVALREIVRALKQVPCADCGVEYPYYVMDFDHSTQHTKAFNLSESSKLGSINRVLEEANKCEVVCANCHRQRTHDRMHNLPL